MMRKRGRWVLAVALVGLLDARASSGVSRRMSLETSGAALASGGLYQASGFDGAIRLPPTGTPSVSYGFTIPDDFQNGPLRVEIQVGSPAAACDVVLRAKYLYRARTGQPRDLGSPNGGFEALNASTPFTRADANKSLIFQTEATARAISLVRFKIAPNGAEFPAFKPGDAINFTIERPGDDVRDTCSSDLHWNALSVVYNAVSSRPAKARVSLDPYASVDTGGGAAVSISGSEAPLRFPEHTSAPFRSRAMWSFVLPEDYVSNTPVDVDILWESEVGGCRAVLRANYVFRSFAGFARDHTLGNATGASSGFDLHSSSTPILDGIYLSAPAGNSTGLARFRVTPSPGTFAPLQAGATVQFGVFRGEDYPEDDCQDIGISGVSFAYTRGPAKNPRRLSLNSVGADLSGFLSDAGGYATVRLNVGSRFGTGFVVPDDHRPDTPLVLQILLETHGRNCTLAIALNHLNRSRPGRPNDGGDASGGLRPLGASTPFTVVDDVLRFSSGVTDATIVARFEIGTDTDVPTLLAGDGVNLGLHRFDDGTDTCPNNVGIAGWSILYKRK